MDDKSPRLRTVNKVVPAFPLNRFPPEFGFKLGKEIIYLLATKGIASLEGDEWEKIFANCIGANWHKSVIGLDDIILGNTAWGAKSIKAKNLEKRLAMNNKIRLVSGRNSIAYSYKETVGRETDPNYIGSKVLQIWNGRVSAVREKFAHLRTVILIKGEELKEAIVFEFDTNRYDEELFEWGWNKWDNLEGRYKSNKNHKFTWQPHGSQFTIIEQIPSDALLIKIKRPPFLDRETTLAALGVDKSWVTVIKHENAQQEDAP